MSTKKFAAVAAGMTLALTLAACGGGGAGTTEEPAEGGEARQHQPPDGCDGGEKAHAAAPV